jgi:hypothetical protein
MSEREGVRVTYRSECVQHDERSRSDMPLGLLVTYS